MLRIAIAVLVFLEIVLLNTFAPHSANATSSDFENYMWSFADVGSSQLVCKKVVMSPQEQVQSKSSDRKVIKMSSTSMVVSDSYCAKTAKPAL